VDTLKKLGDLELKLRELSNEAVNLSSEQMLKLFTIWISKIQEVASAVLSPELTDIFMSRLANAMETFEIDAANQLR
jgi:hypothetical protein